MPDFPAPRVSARPRIVRVFIASTVEDMQEEIDVLTNTVFPELHRRCRERHVEFLEVDLRHGLTAESTEQLDLVAISFAEIEQCRPYFVGILGQRYGWIQNLIDPELVATNLWLVEHPDKSLTELQALHGALNDPTLGRHSFFYLRDPAYLDSLAEERRPLYEAENPEARRKLDELKERIRRSGLPVRENYANAELLGRQILDDLWGAIDRDFPADATPTTLERYAAEHETFALTRSAVYISRDEHLAAIDLHASTDGPPLVVKGNPAVGKSALLANWAKDYRVEHPQDFLIVHFTGSPSHSTDHISLMARVIGEIKRRYRLPEEIPETSQKIAARFPAWLAAAAARGGLIIVLDGLDRMADHGDALDLAWLPETFPPNVRVVVSAKPGAILTALEERGWPTLHVDGFQPEEQRTFVHEYLAYIQKELDTHQVDRILEEPQAANPLFLRALLDEAVSSPITSEQTARIEGCLEADTPDGLYAKILARLERCHDTWQPGTIGRVMSSLWASRMGLHERELIELLESWQGPLPRAVWSRVYQDLQPLLINRSGLLGFLHDAVRLAVETLYLPDAKARRDAAARLAFYFASQKTDDRKIDELPWQLFKVEAWRTLKDCLESLTLFWRLTGGPRQWELREYWRKLGTRYNVVQTYEDVFLRHQKAGPPDRDLCLILERMAGFLESMGRYDGAASFYHISLEIREKLFDTDHPEIAVNLASLAAALRGKGEFKEAEPILRRAVEITEKTRGSDHPELALRLLELGDLLRAAGEYLVAEPQLRQALAIHRNAPKLAHLDIAATLGSLAAALQSKGDLDGAEAALREVLDIREKVFGPEHPDTAACLNELGALLAAKGDDQAAAQTFRRALSICEKSLGAKHPDCAVSLPGLAAILERAGDYEGAEPLLRRALALREQSLGALAAARAAAS
ncbi:MAG: tetratricopeptide repeat protein [Desulfomonile tiedjei]|nr:tetratricopeptide repeat protein [Desulfomonile tiedjei]